MMRRIAIQPPLFDDRLVPIMRAGRLKAAYLDGDQPGKRILVKANEGECGQARQIPQGERNFGKVWFVFCSGYFSIFTVHHYPPTFPLG
jgi:hypothetical protein